MPAQHRATRPRRRRPVMLAGLILPFVLLAGIYLIHIVGIGKPQASDAADAQAAKTCASSTTAASGRCASSPAASPGSRPSGGSVSAAGHKKGSPSPRTHPASSHPASARPAPSHAPSSSPAPSPSASTSTKLGTAAAQQVLALINKARGQAGLPAYTVTAGLDRSSAAHNQRMASGCGLSHQCPGETSLGARETAAGVDWTAAGENIGEGGPEADTASAITQMALTLTQDMLNEKPPDDGHRLNILSSTFHHLGITVQEDSSGTVWMTQDFSN